MALFWLVHEIDGERRVFIQEAGAPITARIKASNPGSTATTSSRRMSGRAPREEGPEEDDRPRAHSA